MSPRRTSNINVEHVATQFLAVSNIAFAYWDTQQLCVYATNAFADMVAIPVADLVGKFHFSDFPSDFHADNKKHIKEALAGRSSKVKCFMPYAVGGQKLIQIEYTPDFSNQIVAGFFTLFSPVDGQSMEIPNKVNTISESARNILEGAGEAMLIVDRQGMIVSANHRCEQLFDYVTGELTGQGLEILMPKAFRESHKSKRDSFFASPSEQLMANRRKIMASRKKGDEFMVEVKIAPLQMGDALFAIATIYNVTEREIIKNEVFSLVNRLKLATENSLVGIWEYDIKSNLLIWDDTMFNLYGTQREDFMGAYEAWRSAVHPDDIAESEENLQLALSGEKEFDTEFRVIWPDKSVHYIKAKAVVLFDEEGKPSQMIGTNWDISKQKFSEIELKDNYNRNIIFINQAPNAIAMFDKNMCYLAASEQWIKDYNLAGVPLVGRSHYEIFPEIGEDWKQIHRECMNGAINKCEEAFFVRADGSSQWITWDVRPWYISEGNIGGILMYTADITASKEQGRESRRMKEILDKTNEVARIGTWEVDFIQQKVVWSSVVKEIYEVPADYQPRLNDFLLFFKEGESKTRIDEAYQNAIGHGIEYDLEVELVTAKGNVKWVRIIGYPVFKNDKCISINGVFHDIDELKRKTLQLKFEEERWKFAVESSGDGLWDWNLQTNKIYFSPQWKNMLKFEEYEISSDPSHWSSHIHPEDVERCRMELERLIKGEIKLYWNEHRVICKGGLEKSVLDRGKVISWSEDGKPQRIIGTCTDMTFLMSIQQELKQSEEQFRQSFENAAIGKALVDPSGRLIQANKSLCSFLGYSKFELSKLNFQEITHPDDLNLDLLLLSELSEGKRTSYQLEKRYFHKNGSIVWGLLNVSAVRNKNGEIVNFISQVEDITSRKRMERELHKANQELSAIFNSESVSIIGTDTNGVITHFNKGAESLLQYTAEEMIGIQTPKIIHLEKEVIQRGQELTSKFRKKIEGFDVFVEVSRHEKYESREWTYIRKDGSTFPVQLIVSALRNEQGVITGFLGVATDITQRKQMEEKVRTISILESKSKEMEQFAYVASHDLREPLLTIINYIKMLRAETENSIGEVGMRYLDVLLRASTRMDLLIGGLLDYSRLSKIKVMQDVDCNELVKDVIADLNATIVAKNASFNIEELPLVRGHALELKLLFQNLIQNAMKFVNEGTSPEIQISARKIGGGWQFKVSDNGIGIPENFLERVFVIFQRVHSRDEYEGTGIGLAHCRKIVELHGGKIWVESSEGNGSTFYFTILTKEI